MRKASKRASDSQGFWAKLTGGAEEKNEEAVELLEQAATQFKLAKLWRKSADCYIRCAELDGKVRGYKSVKMYMEAANMLEKVDRAESFKLIEKVNETLKAQNNLADAAKNLKKMAEGY
jgi:hypothetical protein